MDCRFLLLKILTIISILGITSACNENRIESSVNDQKIRSLDYSENILDYRVSPVDSLDKSGLMFSDQGAWFAYSLQDSTSTKNGFSGPFLMTQSNGQWLSKASTNWNLRDERNKSIIDWNKDKRESSSNSSELFQAYENDSLRVTQKLVFLSAHTALTITSIVNKLKNGITIHPSVSGEFFDIGVSASTENESIKLVSKHSDAIGYFQILNESASIMTDDLYYNSHLKTIFLERGKSKSYVTAQSFIFPEYSWEEEKQKINSVNFEALSSIRKAEKNKELSSLFENIRSPFTQDKYRFVIAKSHLTLQNNWRVPAGEIKHEGLFPSYHYQWFNGFWSWDSWKHAVGLSYFNTELAKNQIRLMLEFQDEDGFIADCVFRDTSIENHNYRNTKPPLLTWAVASIYKKDTDLEFIKEVYPKIKKYHEWWYNKRDQDQDGLCEYGSTDGTLVAAKWESGMDNAIRFDTTEMHKNMDGAYSMNQESVDLNAYLYAEKLCLSTLAKALKHYEEATRFENEAEVLKGRIQTQFYDAADGWFYDTNLEGTSFIKGEGSEGWTALWANTASQEQAEAVKKNMMKPNKFYTKVPFQTMSADHEKFNPLKGYWRGPNWLDQAYFGVKGLRNYGFNEDADIATIQIIKGAEGVLGKGKSIRENYHPITGEGLNAKNFSWSAAHIIMLLMQEKL